MARGCQASTLSIVVAIVHFSLLVGAAKKANPEEAFLEDAEPGADGRSSGHVETPGPNCATAFMNKETGCKTARKMACLEGAFPGSWFVLNQGAVVKASLNMTERAIQMRAGYWIGGQDIRADYISKLPKKDLFAHLDLPVHRCALVSSGAALLGSGLGPKIDSHHLVMRLNNAPVKGFEKDVGRRTTLRLTAAPFSGFREDPEEAVIASWCPENNKCGLKQELETLLDKKAFPLNPLFWKYVNSAYFRKRGVEVSSGMVAFALLAHHCERVSLFGFSGADARDWYYVKREGKYKQIAQSQWLSNQAWVIDEWKLAQPRKRGSEKRGKGGGEDTGDVADEGNELDIEEDEGRRRLSAVLSKSDSALGADNWSSALDLLSGERPGARRALLGSLDTERQCFLTLGEKGVVDLYNGTTDEERAVSVDPQPAATATSGRMKEASGEHSTKQGKGAQKAQARAAAAAVSAAEGEGDFEILMEEADGEGGDSQERAEKGSDPAQGGKGVKGGRSGGSKKKRAGDGAALLLRRGRRAFGDFTLPSSHSRERRSSRHARGGDSPIRRRYSGGGAK